MTDCPDCGVSLSGPTVAIEALSAWMIANSYATGHGDTVDDLIAELDWQHKERLAKTEQAPL